MVITFLPYASFADSAAVLDDPRLGKQRVETLQIQRALLLPTYGWQRHPAVRMWRGHLPALTAYGLAVIDAWTGRGHADAVRAQTREFAPEVDGVPQAELAARGLLPRWLGDEAVHASHRSRLVAKDPDRYRPVFPGAPDDVEYVWPAGGEVPPEPAGERIQVVRTATPEIWLDAGLVPLARLNPAGRTPPAWREQVESFEALTPGTAVGLLAVDGARLHLGRVAGEVGVVRVDGAEHLVRRAEYGGVLARSELPAPAELQNPRALFQVRLATGGAPVAARIGR